MNAYFVFAALIAVILGIVHSYMGEKYLVSPILRSEHLSSVLSGSVSLKKVALRVCWHFATIAMWGTAATLVFLSSLPLSRISLVVARIISLTFAAYTILVFLTPGLRPIHLRRHLAWAAFLAIAVLSWLGTLR
jgi:hypothetical protein